MVRRRRVNVRCWERALLTETLPFETPLYFSNADFCVLAWNYGKDINSVSPLYARLLLFTNSKGAQPTRPFIYRVKKDSQSLRRLGIVHPRSQFRIASF